MSAVQKTKLAVMVMVAVLIIGSAVVAMVQTAQKESVAHPEQRVVIQQMVVVLKETPVVKAPME
tara:strand:+ start:112 stop:303 length:192 start_codon:yes stop_codon:yes gene_type:complete